jgi:hypothetical protein
VPFTAGTGALQVTALQDLGDIGEAESDPVTVEWQWSNYLPGFGFWLLLILLAVNFIALRRSRARWPLAAVLIVLLIGQL